jgi:phosphopantothenoylcysteine decarboxylase/phosphopantothenate--cysteine ligase
MNLKGKKILIAVTGSIAAYKIAELVRLFKKRSAEVKVIMTQSACDFVTPVTLATLSGNPVISTFVSSPEGEWNNHVALGLWADVMIVAPASANTIAKMAHGICDNMVTAVYLSARCPVFFAPAMDLDMYHHESTRQNIEKLVGYGNRQIGPATGELASGLSGEGRMEEPVVIVEVIESFFLSSISLTGKKILISAGPTQEAIDPVRYISNHSSGKMGFAIANALAQKGAEVVIVSGPSSVKTGNHKIKRMDVHSAAEMHEACMKEFDNCDVAIMAAAVADFTPLTVAGKKIKKNGEALTISLQPTVDILAEMGKKKKKKQVLVGFALETDNELDNAVKKLDSKNLDYIILNSLNDKGATFHSDQNKITIIDRNRNKTSFELKSKQLVAEDIIQTILLNR